MAVRDSGSGKRTQSSKVNIVGKINIQGSVFSRKMASKNEKETHEFIYSLIYFFNEDVLFDKWSFVEMIDNVLFRTNPFSIQPAK